MSPCLGEKTQSAHWELGSNPSEVVGRGLRGTMAMGAHCLTMVETAADESTSSDEFAIKTKEQQRASSPRREKLRKKREQQLQDFLTHHRFPDAFEPRLKTKQSCLGFLRGSEELMYPIHVAAANGDSKILRLLLDAGVDVAQRTSKGRLAIQLARANGWVEAAEILENPVKPVKVRDMLKKLEAENGYTELYL
eukprot:s1397_g1.t1